MKALRTTIAALALGFAAPAALASAAHASTIPEGAEVLGCVEVVPGFYSVTIFYQGQVYDVFSDHCPLDP